MPESLIQIWLPQFFVLVMMGIGFLLISKRIDDLRADTMSRLSDMNSRFAEMNSRIERLEDRYLQLEKVIVGKFEEVDGRLARIESHMDLR